MIWTIIGLLAVLALVQGLIEPFLLRTSYASYPLSEEKRELLQKKKTINPEYLGKQIPEPQNGVLRVLFFSDLHTNHFHLPKEYFFKRLLEHHPDLIVFGGDLISREFRSNNGLKLLKRIAVAAAAQSVPVLLVRGNHDEKLSDDALQACGVIVLRNSATRIKLKERYRPKDETALSNEFVLYGLDDRRAGIIDLPKAKVSDALPQADALNLMFSQSRISFSPLVSDANDISVGSLLFAHNPDTVLELSQADCEYFFSGHFHGGQIRLPFRLEFKTLRGEKLSQKGYYNGHFLKNNVTSFISRGVGCVLFPLRFFCRPEITVFDIQNKK